MSDLQNTVLLKKLLLYQKVSFIMGMIINDLCSEMWFKYFSGFVEKIRMCSPTQIIKYILLGQIVGAISTVFVGVFTDRCNGFFGYTKRKSWHALGTVLVTLGFPFLFMKCLFGCDNSKDSIQFIYYFFPIVFFQFGWASIQVGHLTLLNELTADSQIRLILISFRNANTLLVGFLVNVFSWGFVRKDGENVPMMENHLDEKGVMVLAFCIIGIGLVFSICFHIFTPELHHSKTKGNVHSEIFIENVKKMDWLDWLKEPQYYLIGFLYAVSRSINNLFAHLFEKYASTRLLISSEEEIIKYGMVMGAIGFLAAIISIPIIKYFGRKETFLFGLISVITSQVWFSVLTDKSLIWGPITFMGIGLVTMLNTSVSMMSDLIGTYTNHSGFVYGTLSFPDQIISGVSIVLFCTVKSNGSESDGQEVRNMMLYIIVSVCIFGLSILLLVYPIKSGSLKKMDGGIMLVDGHLM